MDHKFSNLGRCVSIFDRLMKMYYEHGLADYEIGWGQQFYVEYIYDHPGTSAQQMVKYICVDKATLTKAVKKLLEIEYISVVSDDRDKRIKHLYLTEKAVPAAMRIKKIHSSFYNTFSAGLSSEDISGIEEAMEKMVDNINQKVWHRMENYLGE